MRTGVKTAIKKSPVHKPFRWLCSLKDNDYRELDSDSHYSSFVPPG